MTRNVQSTTDTKFGSLSWAEVIRDSIDAPSSRVGHSLICFEGSLYLFGGKDDYFASNELWQYHTEANVWTKLVCAGPKPARLFNHRVVLYDRKIFVFGGSTTTNFSLWVFDFDMYEWEMYSTHGKVCPNNRHSHSVALYNNTAYMYGGYTAVGIESDELWQYDLDANEWISVRLKSEERPPTMFGHTAAFHGTHMWIYGGSCCRNLLNTLWCLDTELWRWKEVSRQFSPPGLYYHISIVTGDVMLVYGGTTDSLLPYSGMWRFNFETEEWTHMVSKELPALTCHAAALSYVRVSQPGYKKQEAGRQANVQLTHTANNIKVYSNEDEQFQVHYGTSKADMELRPITVQSIELRPTTNQSIVSKTSVGSNESHMSLPGTADEDDMPGQDVPGTSPPIRIHRAVYENRVVNAAGLEDQNDRNGFCVTNPIYDSYEGRSSPVAALTKSNRITFLDPSIVRDTSVENSEDSGSQGSRSSLKKKKYKRGYNTEFFIAGHGPEPLSKHIVLYQCKIG